MAKELAPELVEKCNNNFQCFRHEYGYNFSHNDISIIGGNGDNGISEGKTFVGKFIAKADECDNFGNIIIDESEIKKELKPFENYLKNDETSIKIIAGTMLM